jgi:hypothetical protein
MLLDDTPLSCGAKEIQNCDLVSIIRVLLFVNNVSSSRLHQSFCLDCDGVESPHPLLNSGSIKSV